MPTPRPTSPADLPAASLRSQVTLPMLRQIPCDATVFTFHGLIDAAEHLTVGLGHFKQAGLPLVRLHSECLTGDVLGSQKCDCGPQLSESIRRINDEGGLLLYLRQEGRGIGLYNKMDAYALQAQGIDTYAANRMLGFPDDLRNYGSSAQMLKVLGHSRIRLLTNNPDKGAQLESYGIEVVEVVPTATHSCSHNRDYIETKRLQTQHTLNPAKPQTIDLGQFNVGPLSQMTPRLQEATSC